MPQTHKVTIDQFLAFLKSKNYTQVKLFVVSKILDTDKEFFLPNIGYWVNVVTPGMQHMLIQHMPFIAHPPSHEALHDKKQRLQANDLYMGKVYDLQQKIEEKGFKVKIIDQMLR